MHDSSSSPKSIRKFSLVVGGCKLGAVEWGEGKEALLCLHGYRQQKEIFRKLFKQPLQGVRIVALDLPLDGESECPEPVPVLNQAWFRALWKALTAEIAVTTWQMLGFSQGGRWAMFLQQAVGYPAEHVFLLAPDGLRSHWGQRLIQGRLGQAVLTPLIRRPSFLIWLGTNLNRWKLLHPSAFRMFRFMLEDQDTIEHLLKSLRLQRKMRIKHQWLINSPDSSTWHFLWGERDGLLNRPVFLLRRMGGKGRFQTISAGHDLMREAPEQVLSYIRKNSAAD